MTRKYIITDSDNGIRKSKTNEFLIPNPHEYVNRFIGIETGKICQYGLVVYTGYDLDKNIVTDKMIENGIIPRADSRIFQMVEDLLSFIKSCKVGDVIEVLSRNEKYEYRVTGLRIKRIESNIP